MKFRKSLIAAMLTGAGVIAVAPAINAAEYSTSVSGNIRVEATSITKNNGVNNADVETLSTNFGGDDDEANTGGDTYLQWNHNFANDEGTTTGGGFLRFTGDGDVRINVNAVSELGNYKGELKAEWEQDGLTGDVTSDRDQFAKLTHVPIGLYYKIGREQWLDNNKGYTSDFLSQTERFAWVSNENRFSAHALGWSGAGIDVALLIQRDNSANSHARPSGQDVSFPKTTLTTVDGVEGFVPPADTSSNATGRPAAPSDRDVSARADVSGFGVLLSYDGGDSVPVQVDLNIGSATAETNIERLDEASDGKRTFVNENRENDGKGFDESYATSFTQLHLAFPIGVYIPFLNFGSATQTNEVDGKEISEVTTSGWNLGASLGFGPTDLIVAFGTQTAENKNTASNPVANAADAEATGFDLIWATNQEPLKVSLAYSSKTTSLSNNKAAEDQTTSQYGVRLDFGF